MKIQEIKQLPNYMTKEIEEEIEGLEGLEENIWQKTIYGSYVDLSDYGISQQKNATTFKDLNRQGFTPEDSVSEERKNKVRNYWYNNQIKRGNINR